MWSEIKTWNGGGIPIPYGETTVRVWTRENGQRVGRAGNFDWLWRDDDPEEDIIAYQVQMKSKTATIYYGTWDRWAMKQFVSDRISLTYPVNDEGPIPGEYTGPGGVVRIEKL